MTDADALAQNTLKELMLARSNARVAAGTLTDAGAPADAIAQMFFVTGYAELLMALDRPDIPLHTNTHQQR